MINKKSELNIDNKVTKYKNSFGGVGLRSVTSVVKLVSHILLHLI